MNSRKMLYTGLFWVCVTLVVILSSSFVLAAGNSCTNDNACMEIACPNGGMVHEKCQNGICVLTTSCPTICPEIAQPVCGSVHVDCFRAPCPPLEKTFTNMCFLNGAHATFLHNGACDTNVIDTNIPVVIDTNEGTIIDTNTPPSEIDTNSDTNSVTNHTTDTNTININEYYKHAYYKCSNGKEFDFNANNACNSYGEWKTKSQKDCNSFRGRRYHFYFLPPIPPSPRIPVTKRLPRKDFQTAGHEKPTSGDQEV